MGRRAFLVLLGLLAPSLRAIAERPPRPVGPPVSVPPKPVGPPIEVLKPSVGIRFDRDHKCDNCGHEEPPDANGRIRTTVLTSHGDWHTHECPKCKTVYWHYDDGRIPVSEDCPDGKCPAGATKNFPPRGGILRRLRG